MRPEVAWILERIESPDDSEAASPKDILDYGPLEGIEVTRLAAAGHQVTCLNLLGKTAVEGATYVDSAESLAAGEFDICISVHLFALGLIAWAEVVAHSLAQLARPGGRIFVAVPVGMPGEAHARQFGQMRVFARANIIEIFRELSQAELVNEAYFEHGQPVFWDDIQGGQGIAGKEIVQVGAYEFRKASPQRLSVEERQSQQMAPGYHAEWVDTVKERSTPVQALMLRSEQARADRRACQAAALWMGGA
jgi:hypothetical protein